MRSVLVVALLLAACSLSGQEAPLVTLYPEIEVVEYVESGASAQYLLRTPGKPAEVLLFLSRQEGDLAFEVRKGKRKVWASGALIPAGQGRWQPRIDRLAPGLGRALFFLLDRATMTQAQPSVSPLQSRKAENACRKDCIDAFLQGLDDAERQRGLYPAGKAVRRYGFGSVAFRAYAEDVTEALQSYQQCQQACE